jgi:hypothetical protein
VAFACTDTRSNRTPTHVVHEDGVTWECHDSQDSQEHTAREMRARRVMVKYGLDITDVLCAVEFNIPQIRAIMVKSECNILLDRLVHTASATLGSCPPTYKGRHIQQILLVLGMDNIPGYVSFDETLLSQVQVTAAEKYGYKHCLDDLRRISPT